MDLVKASPYTAVGAAPGPDEAELRQVERGREAASVSCTA